MATTKHDGTCRLLPRERHSPEPASIGRRWRTHTARGHRCRWGEADCLCQRRRWEHHRASAVPVMARETQLFFWRKKRQPPLQKIYRHVRGKSKIGEVFFSGSDEACGVETFTHPMEVLYEKLFYVQPCHWI